MVQEDKEFLRSIEWNNEFHDALIATYPDGIPQHIKDVMMGGYIEPYDAGVVSDDLYGCTEYPD